MYQFSKREKILLFVLWIVVILVLGFMFLISPALEDKLVLQEQLSQEQLTQLTMQTDIAGAAAAAQQKEQARAEAAAIGSTFYEPMSNTQLSNLAAGFFDVHGLTGVSMSVSGMTVEDLAGIQPTLASGDSYAWNEFLQSAQSGAAADEGDDTQTGAQAAPATAQVLCNTVTITGQGDPAGLRSLLTDLGQRMPVRVQSFKTGEDGRFDLVISFYMLDPVE